jgi:hypothetical protein
MNSAGHKETTMMTEEKIEFDFAGTVGPRVKVWGDVDAAEVDAACPDGWEIDWNTTPANLDSTRDGERGYSHPLVSKSRSVKPRKTLASSR